MRLLLVRHGESWHSLRQVVAGPLGCPGLTAHGREQAAALRRRWAGGAAAVDVLLSSAAARARETAEILGRDRWPAAVRAIDCDLCELHPGDGDGLSVQEFGIRYGSFDWLAEPDRPVAPGGESWNQFTSRVQRTMDRFARDYAGQTVLAVTHAGFLVWSLFHLFAIPRPGTGARIDPDFTSVTEWEYLRSERAWRLVAYNDTAHLR
ncbi:phosphoglycerate mutase [Rhizocola hellebori]|uniref:Phosphoglycerate mutase n=1 Tax=Rhizocola hellebori TaxID=1392758 RepID=A0A8J3Q928_9ACTN|nr:histidine phosphatase family protein [Rhizocola hellebori]GIH05421.1 phosphoglycerate mutase [Rhizocola hellebori]